MRGWARSARSPALGASHGSVEVSVTSSRAGGTGVIDPRSDHVAKTQATGHGEQGGRTSIHILEESSSTPSTGRRGEVVPVGRGHAA